MERSCSGRSALPQRTSTEMVAEIGYSGTGAMLLYQLVTRNLYAAQRKISTAPSAVAMLEANVNTIPEKRRAIRRPLGYTAWIAISEDAPWWGCEVNDVSATGARIAVEKAHELPETFDLVLTGRGNVRRTCRVVWRKHMEVGVRFQAPSRGARPLLDNVESPALADNEVS